MSRFKNRPVANNSHEMYQDIHEDRGVKHVKQYATPEFRKLDDDQLESIRYHKYYWTVGERYWRLAQRYYNDRNLWWIIARFNNKPTEGHVSPGDEIRIPKNVVEARELLR